MGFPIGITETGTGNDLLQQWWLVRTGNKNKEHLWARTWSARSRKKEWDVVAHRKACFLEFWIKFSGVQSAPKTCFQTQKCWRFDKFTFWESNIWQMYVSCISWCTWCVRGGPTGRSLWRFTSPYLSSFSSLSSDSVDLHLPIYPPSPRCPPIWVFQFRSCTCRSSLVHQCVVPLLVVLLLLRLRLVLLNNPSYLMHRLHIVIVTSVSPCGPWNAVETRTRDSLFGGTFFLSHGQKKEGSRERGKILTETGNRNRNKRKQHLFPNVSETRSRNTKENPITGPNRKYSIILNLCSNNHYLNLCSNFSKIKNCPTSVGF